MERRLIESYIRHVEEAVPLRETLRKASEELAASLEKNNLWFSLDIRDPETADLLETANSARRYLLDQTAPRERELHQEQRRVELKVLTDLGIMESTGTVPEDFMDSVRGLDYLYTLQDELWEMKVTLLLKIIGLSNNVHANYLTANPKRFSNVLEPLSASLFELDAIVGKASEAVQGLTRIRDRYRAAESDFHAVAAKTLGDDRNLTLALAGAVKSRADALEAAGTPNDRNHAALLRDIGGVLSRRLDAIDQGMRAQADAQEARSPLHVPETLGSSPETRALAEEYRAITREFMGRTGEKLIVAARMGEHLVQVRRALEQERLFFLSLVGQAPLDDADKQEIMAQALELTGGLDALAGSLERELSGITAKAGDLDFSRPETLVADRESAEAALAVSRDLDGFARKVRDFDVSSFQMDLQLYGLISHLDLKKLEKLKPYTVLELTSRARDRFVGEFMKELEALGAVSGAETLLADRLGALGRSILHKGQLLFREKTRALKALAPGSPSPDGKPYEDFLGGVTEQLEVRLQELDTLLALAGETPDPKTRRPDCPECWPVPDTLSELAGLGGAFADVLGQMDDLAGMEDFFAPEVTGGTLYGQTRAMFELSRRLGNEPYFQINDTGMDVVFKAGSVMVTVKGIGDPALTDLALFSPENDYLLYRPFIGGWLTGFSPGKDLLAPLSSTLLDRASSLVSRVRTVGGKLATFTGKVAKATLDLAKEGVRTTVKVGSKVLGAVKDIGVNTLKNAFVDDNTGRVSWWKVGGYALGALACGAAAAGTAGLAAGPCIALAVGAGFDVAKGAVDTAAMDKYNLLSKNKAKWLKFGLDIASIVTGGYLNFKDAGKAWAKMSNIGKAMTLLGMKPSDLKSFFSFTKNLATKVEWSKVKNFFELGRKGLVALTSTLGAFKNLLDWHDKIKPYAVDAWEFTKLYAAAKLRGENFVDVTVTDWGALIKKLSQVASGNGFFTGNSLEDWGIKIEPGKIITYGNWYGPGWWGGGRDPDRPGGGAPINSLDAIAMKHDFLYQIAEEQGRIHGPAEEQRIKSIADAIAVAEARALDPDPTKWKIPELKDPELAAQKAREIGLGFSYLSPGRELLSEGLDTVDPLLDFIRSSGATQQTGGPSKLTTPELEAMAQDRIDQWKRDHPGAAVPGAVPGTSGAGQTPGATQNSGVDAQGNPLTGTGTGAGTGTGMGTGTGTSTGTGTGGTPGTLQNSGFDAQGNPLTGTGAGTGTSMGTGTGTSTGTGTGTGGVSLTPSGALLPQGGGAGQTSGGNQNGPGVSLLPGGGVGPDGPVGQTSTHPTVDSPYKDVQSPAGKIKNPYRGMKNPFTGVKSPF
jgi:hypothetical protein